MMWVWTSIAIARSTSCHLYIFSRAEGKRGRVEKPDHDGDAVDEGLPPHDISKVFV